MHTPRIYRRLFWILFLVSLGQFLGFSPAYAQSNEPSICPSGVELYKQAERYLGPEKNLATGTLLWLERGDAMWSYHSQDTPRINKKIVDILENYKLGRAGYPKRKKTVKRLENYKTATRAFRHPNIHGGSKPAIPRSKGVPAAPPAKAIAFAEKMLGCRYVPISEKPMGPTARAEATADRAICIINETEALSKMPTEYSIDIGHEELERRVDQAVAILLWKYRGTKAFTERNELGQNHQSYTKGVIRDFTFRGFNTIVAPRMDIHGALGALKKDTPVPVLLSTPPPDMVEWAEDYLNCRYDGSAWKDGAEARIKAHQASIARTHARIKQERETWIANAPKREAAERRKAEAEKKRQAEAAAKRKKWANETRGRWRRPASENRPSNTVGIGVYFDDNICKNVQRHMENRSTLTANEQAWGNWYAFYGHDELCGSLPATYRQWLPGSKGRGRAGSNFSLSDGLRDMGNAAACTRQERKCTSDGQYERCRMVTVNIC